MSESEETPPEETPPEETQDQDAAIANLQGALSRLQTARKKGESSAAAKKAMGELTKAVGGLDDETFRELMATDEMADLMQVATAQRGEILPGGALYDDKGREIGRQPYSHADAERIFGVVTWTVPQHPYGRRIWPSVTWNGVDCPVPLRVGEEVTTAACFKGIVEESYRETTRTLQNQSNIHAALSGGRAEGSSVEAGTGFHKQTASELVASGEWVDR